MAFSIKVDTRKFERRISEYFKNVKETVAEALPAIATEMVEEIRMRTPSKETEYDFLMTGGGTSGGVIKRVPLAGDRSADSDTVLSGGERIRFIREPGMWLEDLVVNPATYNVDETALRINLGLVPELEARSRFSWQNRDRAGNEYEHTSAYGVWSFFEYGVDHTIYPHGPWKLRPDDMTHHLDMPSEMFKSYPRFGMYTGFHKSTFIEAVSARIRDVTY